MAVDGHLGEDVDVDEELFLARDLGGEVGVQGVDALDDEDAARAVQRQRLVGVVAFVLAEVELAQGDGLAGEELEEVGVQAGHVDGLEAFVVQVAVLVARVAPVPHEVVVGGEEGGAQAQHAQVGTQAHGEGGLPGGTGAGHEDEVGAGRARGDAVGEGGEALFVEGLDGVDDVGHGAVGDGGVELAGVADADDLAPAQVLGVDLEEEVVGRHGVELGGRLEAGELEDEAVAQGEDVEEADDAGARGQHALGQVVEALADGHAQIGRVAVLQEERLVALAVLAEALEHLFVAHDAVGDGRVARDEGGQLAAQGGHLGLALGLGHVPGPEEGVVAEALAHAAMGFGEGGVQDLGQEEAEGAAVDLPAFLVGQREGFEAGVHHHGGVQGEDVVVHQRGDGGQAAHGFGEDVAQVRAVGHGAFAGLAVDGHFDGVVQRHGGLSW